ncbi:hypothetical protein L3Q82_001784 [Scortum barcoo]|uniref:Uncharacterized protein n=1 Tax=Scortum barcoo TaxID=214431 RepID=A0ACB8W4K1_9TELE|nr:hypothetical protein L3Q82_001784 [Scortum barcoo]
MSHREEASGKTQDTLEKLCLSAGLGTPRGPPGRAGGSVWDWHYRGPTLEPGPGVGARRRVPGGPGLCPRDPSRAQPKMATWARLPVGSPPTGRSMRGRCYVVWVAVMAGGLDDPTLDQNSGNRDMECHLALGGKEPELVWEVERYQLEIVGLTSMHSLGSGIQLLERGWTLHYLELLLRVSGGKLVWACLIALPSSAAMC